MNPRLELYRSGAGLTVRAIYPGKGRRVIVLDPDRRARAACRALLAAGADHFTICHAIRRPLSFVRAVAREEERKQSNFSVAAVGLNP